ncbi:MAG: hypothetical protein IPJ77_02945 [Planctomycetes bacterium]|nr:hypothetical protein [Planctomycetota bacterium]
MTPPIVPALFTLLATLAPARLTGDDFVVRTVDGSGAPVAGIAVRVAGVVQPDVRLVGWETSSREFARMTTDERGEARFDGERLRDRRVPGAALRVEPCVPTLDALAVALTPGALPKEPLVITLPPLARLEVELPAKPNVRVRLLRAFTEREAPLRANERVACLDWTKSEHGAAVLPHVGVGLRFEAALAWDGLMGEHVVSFAGPTRAGETTVVSDTSTAKLLVFDGRALDERGTPLAAETMTAQCWAKDAFTFTGASCDLETDDQGRFRVEMLAPANGGSLDRSGLRIACIRRATGEPPAAIVAVEEPARTGFRALGELRFVPDAEERSLALYTDDDIEQELRRRIDFPFQIDGRTPDWVRLLAEAVRRGGERWKRVVTELGALRVHARDAGLRRRHAEDEHDSVPSPPAAHERRILTALRRLADKPDPLVLEVLDGPVYEARFPTVPVVRCRVRSVEETERVKLTLGCQDENVGVVLDPSGRTADAPRHAARATQPRLCRHAPWFDTELEPGGVVDFVVDLPDRITLDEPGEHELAIVIDEDLRRGVDGPAPAFALRSAPFRVKLTADPIRLTRAAYDGLRHELTSIPRDSCVKLVRAPWSPATTFAQDDLEPQDRIFRAGWKALPVLIDALDDPKVEARHQDWALGLLFDVTGLHQPAGDAYAASLIGRTCWEDAWPTTRRDVVFSDDRGNGYVVPDGTTLADLKSAWKALRVKLDVVIE